MYALWDALTDWVECKPEEEHRARAEMVGAAREWLALNSADDGAVDSYFECWRRRQPDHSHGVRRRAARPEAWAW